MTARRLAFVLSVVVGLALAGLPAAASAQQAPEGVTAAAALKALADVRQAESVPTYLGGSRSPHGPVRAAAKMPQSGADPVINAL